MSFPISVLLFATLTGCTLVRTPIIDDPLLDAGERPDVPGLDAPLPDGSLEDTPLPPGDLGPCEPTDTTCDRVDDDCDGVVDNSGCTIGATCVAFTIEGIAYQSCPAITGIDAWSGACRRMGMGYELASFADEREQDLVRDRLATLRVDAPHWIAANDFDKNGEYVWWDGAILPALAFDGASDDPARRCVAFRTDGLYEEGNCDGAQRVLCSADLGMRRCDPVDEVECNTIDDDCDGNVDEGSECGQECTASTFWTHVYYACAGTRRGDDQAPAHCDANLGASRLATVNHSTELSVLADRIEGDSWVALSQSTNQLRVTSGWHWPDTGVIFGVEATPSEYPWGSGEPNDGGDGNENNQENCALIRAGDFRFDDRNCNDEIGFVCENTWSFP